MSEGDHGLHHAVAPGVTRDETRNDFDEERLTFDTHGSSTEAKKCHSTVRSRECRRRKKLGLQTRTIRIAPKQVTKLIESGNNMAHPSPLSVLSNALKIDVQVHGALCRKSH